MICDQIEISAVNPRLPAQVRAEIMEIEASIRVFKKALAKTTDKPFAKLLRKAIKVAALELRERAMGVQEAWV